MFECYSVSYKIARYKQGHQFEIEGGAIVKVSEYLSLSFSLQSAVITVMCNQNKNIMLNSTCSMEPPLTSHN